MLFYENIFLDRNSNITIKEIEAFVSGNFYYSSQVEAVGPAYYTGSFQIGPSSPAPLPYILQQAKTKVIRPKEDKTKIKGT